MIFRLLRWLVTIALFGAAVIAVVKFVGVPFAEARAADAIEESVGGEAEVTMEAPFHPRLVLGEVGDVTITMTGLVREGAKVRLVRVVVEDADIDIASLLDEGITLAFSRMRARAEIGEAALAAAIAPRLREAGVRGKVSVDVTRERVVVKAGPLSVPCTLEVVDRDVLVLQPLPGVPGSARFAQRIDLGPLPYGIRLRSVQLRPGVVALIGGRPAGEQSLP